MNSYNNINMKKKIGILDWGIVLSIILLLFIIYIPRSIWMEEKKDRNESRFRMKAIANAANFFKELTGHYSKDGGEIFLLVEAAIDSLYADSLFTGKQKIFVNNTPYNINIEKGFDYRADTTFSESEKIKKFVVDTLYTVLMIKDEFVKKNNLSNLKKIEIKHENLDTLFINSSSLKQYKEDPSFFSIIKKEYKERVEIVSDYLRKKYHLNNDFLTCPLTRRPYLLDVTYTESEDEVFTVTSPVKKTDSESRYIFFKYDPGDHGYIRSGITSWAE